MNTTSETKLTFGVNAYDQCPNETGRYHVVDDKGFIRCKSQNGYIAYDHAGNLSDREAGVTFTAIDTRDGSVYGYYIDGEGF